MLFQKPVGVFHLLDDESNFPKASDLSFLEKCHYNHALNELYSRLGGEIKEFRNFNATVLVEIWLAHQIKLRIYTFSFHQFFSPIHNCYDFFNCSKPRGKNFYLMNLYSFSSAQNWELLVWKIGEKRICRFVVWSDELINRV